MNNAAMEHLRDTLKGVADMGLELSGGEEKRRIAVEILNAGMLFAIAVELSTLNDCLKSKNKSEVSD